MRKLGFGAVLVMLAVTAASAGRRADDDERMLAMLDPSRPVDQAILSARDAVEADPTSAQLQIELGNAYRYAALVSESRAAFEEATRLDPDNSISWNNLGVMYQFEGKSGSARRSFRAAIEADPRNAEARYNLAHILFEDGEYDRAVTEMKSALMLRPELGDGRRNPRANRSKLVLPSRLSLYADTFGGNTLSPMKAEGTSTLVEAMDTPWLGLDSQAQPASAGVTPAAAPGVSGEAGAAPAADPAAAGEPAPPAQPVAPIILGPNSPGADSSVEAGGQGEQEEEPSDVRSRANSSRRRIRGGGPLPPKPKRD